MQIRKLQQPYEFTHITQSEKYLRIFYRKSQSNRTITSRYRILKKFSIHTHEEACFFEEMFDTAYEGFITRLKEQHNSLSTYERIILAFMKLEIKEKNILKNLGFTPEELKRTLFSLCKKLHTDVQQLSHIAKTI
jgi:uncharacterized Zn-finger protein